MPSSDAITRLMLVEYVTGDLADPAAREQIEAHLRATPADAAYAERVRLIIDALAVNLEAPAGAETTQRIVDAFQPSGRTVGTLAERLLSLERVVMKLVFDSRARPAIAGFRGETDARQMAWEAPWGRVDIEIGTLTGDLRQIRGQVTIDDTHRAPSGVALFESGGGDAPVTAATDARGRFLLETPTGVFDLLVAVDGEALVASGIELA